MVMFNMSFYTTIDNKILHQKQRTFIIFRPWRILKVVYWFNLQCSSENFHVFFATDKDEPLQNTVHILCFRLINI